MSDKEKQIRKNVYENINQSNQRKTKGVYE